MISFTGYSWLLLFGTKRWPAAFKTTGPISILVPLFLPQDFLPRLISIIAFQIKFYSAPLAYLCSAHYAYVSLYWLSCTKAVGFRVLWQTDFWAGLESAPTQSI